MDYTRLVVAAGRLISRDRNFLKDRIEKNLNVAWAFEEAARMVGTEGKTIDEAIKWMITQGIEPISYYLMFDWYAPRRCKHTEGDNSICKECLDPILNRWVDRHDVLLTMAQDFVMLWEDLTGENYYE